MLCVCDGGDGLSVSAGWNVKGKKGKPCKDKGRQKIMPPPEQDVVIKYKSRLHKIGAYESMITREEIHDDERYENGSTDFVSAPPFSLMQGFRHRDRKYRHRHRDK